MHFFHFRDLLSVESGREVRGDGLGVPTIFP